MGGLDTALLAEKAAAVERHLERVEDRLPARAEDLQPASDASDAVILHLWQAVQLTIDIALSACLRFRLGTPPSYAAAFRRLVDAGMLNPQLGEHLAKAAGFRNVLAHAYENLDMGRVHQAATYGPDHLRAFLGAMARALDQGADES